MTDTAVAQYDAPVIMPDITVEPSSEMTFDDEVIFQLSDLSVYYGSFRAVRNVDMQINKHKITAFIGPSGCGKTTVLRCFNRMNDLIRGARVEGSLVYQGVDLYGADVAPAELRGTAFGVFNLISGVALLIGSVIAGGLWTVYGPAATFYAGAAFAAATAVGMGFARR